MTGDYQPGALAKALAAQHEPVPYPPVVAETVDAQLMQQQHDAFMADLYDAMTRPIPDEPCCDMSGHPHMHVTLPPGFDV